MCYGGRIDNEFDEKALRSFLHRFFCQDAYSLDHQLVFPEPAQETGSAPAPILVPEGRTSKAFAEWITALPDSQVPSWVGLPADSDMMLLTRQGSTVLEGWLLLQSALADDEAVVEQEGAGGASERSALPVGTQGGPGPKWSRSLAASVEKWLAQMPAPLEAPQSPRTAPAPSVPAGAAVLGGSPGTAADPEAGLPTAGDEAARSTSAHAPISHSPPLARGPSRNAPAPAPSSSSSSSLPKRRSLLRLVSCRRRRTWR